MHVLLIEPDRILARTYAQALSEAGCTVRHAVSAQQAVHEADQQTPDVVLLELQLPQHNGVEFLYEFRSYSEWLKVPVVVHSMVPPQELESAATLQKELGVADVLYKPETSLRRLCQAVQKLASITP
ncbi:MAG TPA: response regulator [Candidatus Saccharimonadales bacterium]|jgi:two-component system KDP operon response regulator KdpE